MKSVYKYIGHFLILMGTVNLCGCIYIPHPESVESEKGRVSNKDYKQLVKGKSNREEVLLKLGEPDAVMNNNTVFLYAWDTSRAFFITINAGGEYVRHTYVILGFDKNGLLRSKIKGRSAFHTTPTRALKILQKKEMAK